MTGKDTSKIIAIIGALFIAFECGVLFLEWGSRPENSHSSYRDSREIDYDSSLEHYKLQSSDDDDASFGVSKFNNTINPTMKMGGTASSLSSYPGFSF